MNSRTRPRTYVQLDADRADPGQPGPLPPVVIPTILTIDAPYGYSDEFSIYQWDERAPLNKAHCLDFGVMVTPKDVEDILGIVPMFWGDMLMRDHLDNNGVLSETIR